MGKTIQVVAAVIRDGDRVFATARGYGEYKGYWEFPGGKIEPGETGEAALRREIREELATDIEVGRKFAHVSYDYPAFHLDMDCYFCRVLSGKLTLLEAEDAKWLAADELEQVAWLPADRMILSDIRRELEDGRTI